MPNRILRDCTDSEAINSLSDGAEKFFYRLIQKADDYGRFHGNVKLLRPALYPLQLELVREADLDRWIAECVKASLVRLYMADGKKVLEIVKFRQQIRASQSKFPALPSSCIADDALMHTKTETESETKTNTGDSFAEFWRWYPKKVGKGAAEKAFSRIHGISSLLPVLLASIEAWRKTDQWRKDAGQYIPNPATWLNQRRWEDTIGVDITPLASPNGRNAGTYNDGNINDYDSKVIRAVPNAR